MTDADVGVPIDFFANWSSVPNDVSAVIAPFVHVPEGDDDQRAAMAAYDVICSHVDGLQAAGSPYAFHTIGSLISHPCPCLCCGARCPQAGGGGRFLFAQ